MAVTDGQIYSGKVIKFYPDGDGYINASGEYTCDIFKIRILDVNAEDIEAQVCFKTGTERKKYEEGEIVNFKVKSLKAVRYTIDIIKDTVPSKENNLLNKPLINNAAKSVAAAALNAAVNIFPHVERPIFFNDDDHLKFIFSLAEQFEDWINKRG